MVAYNPSPDFDVLSLNVARPIAVARRALPWLVGPAVFLVRGSSLELADASACPGLLELISIGVVRSRPDLPVGELFVGLQVVVMAAALAAFIALACRYTRLWSAIAAATASVTCRDPPLQISTLVDNVSRSEFYRLSCVDMRADRLDERVAELFGLAGADAVHAAQRRQRGGLHPSELA